MMKKGNHFQNASSLYHLYRLLWTSLDWLFPPVCGGCRKPGFRWCDECQAKVCHPRQPICDICGIPLEHSTNQCLDCNKVRPKYKVLRAWSAFDGPVQDALHSLKYRRDIPLGDALAANIYDYVEKLNWPVDMLIPVPLGRNRLKQRGYNQVALIGYPLSLALRIPYASNALVRLRETSSQVGLTRLERRENVRGAFEARENLVKDRTVLLIDDVATTGSTLSSCAQALYEAHARDVFAFAVSRALPHHGLKHA